MILEDSDLVTHLLHTGMGVEYQGLFSVVPQFIDTLELEGQIYHRISVVLGDCFGWVIFVEADKHGKKLENWIREQKGDIQ